MTEDRSPLNLTTLSADFLRCLYRDLTNKTVIAGGIIKSDLVKLINSRQKIVCCGHGSPSGLFGVSKFPEGPYIIDDTMVSALRNNVNTIYIWCNADVFVLKNGLNDATIVLMQLSLNNMESKWEPLRRRLD